MLLTLHSAQWCGAWPGEYVVKRALLAGINRYEDPGIGRLLCAEKDALALELFLSERCGFAAQSLINEQATKRRITARLREICSELKDGDLFFFYFGGHGHEDPHTGQAVLLPWDVRLSDIEDQLNPELVPVRGIESASARCGASRFLVLDACRTPLRSGTKDSQARLEETAVRDIQAMVLEEARESAPLVTTRDQSPQHTRTRRSLAASAVKYGTRAPRPASPRWGSFR